MRTNILTWAIIRILTQKGNKKDFFYKLREE